MTDKIEEDIKYIDDYETSLIECYSEDDERVIGLELAKKVLRDRKIELKKLKVKDK